MSTRTTLMLGSDFHLFQDLADDEIYLQLGKDDFFELTVKLPKPLLERLVKYLETEE